jgi:hypothetical protein
VYQYDVSGGTAAPIPTPPHALDDPLPLPIRTGRLTRWIAPIVSLCILMAVLFQLRHIDLATIKALLPTSLAFWTLFAAYYVTAPLADWVIFKRLWAIPTSGFFALVRKMVGNEILLGYIGEVYFYGWARRRTDITGAPFAAIKDVTILSAMVGNAVTIVMLALAYPLLNAFHLGVQRETLIGSIAIVLCTSFGVMLFRRRLFSLPWNELAFVTVVRRNDRLDCLDVA